MKDKLTELIEWYDNQLFMDSIEAETKIIEKAKQLQEESKTSLRGLQEKNDGWVSKEDAFIRNIL